MQSARSFAAFSFLERNLVFPTTSSSSSSAFSAASLQHSAFSSFVPTHLKAAVTTTTTTTIRMMQAKAHNKQVSVLRTTSTTTTRRRSVHSFSSQRGGGLGAAARLVPRLGFDKQAPFLKPGFCARQGRHALAMRSQGRHYANGFNDGPIAEVEFSAENANAVTLIGRLGREPEVKYLEDGKVTANVSLAVYRGKNQSAHWFELDFWNEDARQVADHLRKGQQVQVRGRLTQNTWRDKMTGQKREKIRVVCSEVALVRGGAQQQYGGGGGGGGGGYDSFQSQGQGRAAYGGRGGGSGGGGGSVATKDVEGRWAALFCNPNDFWDNRSTKRNPKAPDFKHKETGDALWITSRDTPAWVESSLKELDMNKQVDFKSLLGSQQQQPGGAGGMDPPQQQQQQQGGGNPEEIPF